MFKARRDALRELLISKPFVSLEEMREMFPDVSEMTLRRDVEFFENEGLVIKVRGGCRSVGQISAQGGEVVNLSAKRSIAEAATSFLETGRSIFIDSGTTMRTLSEYIPDMRYSFTTTDPRVALELCRCSSASVNMVGGRIEGVNNTVTGLQASRFLSDINIDIAFLTPTGFDEENGFTVASFNECELKRIVVEKAKKVVMLMDSSKFGRSLPYTFCSVDDTDVIITDVPPEADVKRKMLLSGVQLICAR
ncbi:MAG: DeoR/GlpR transcriptional regulator [Clostridia bacterium]|nr:DeoR/GlpR transcriptional regulator [Clostridia bacterium]